MPDGYECLHLIGLRLQTFKPAAASTIALPHTTYCTVVDDRTANGLQCRLWGRLWRHLWATVDVKIMWKALATKANEIQH